MKVFLCLVCLVVIFHNISATPANVQCKDQLFGLLPLGKTQPPNLCGTVTCKENGKISIDRCVALIVAAGTTIIPEDLSKPFPDCCEKAIKTPPKDCYIKGIGPLSLGKTQPPNMCGTVTCKENGETNIERCPAIIVAAGAQIIPADLSKPFPECCETAVKAPL